MSSGDFNSLVIRNTTSYNPDGSYVQSGLVFTVGDKGKQSWTNDLNLDQLTVSSVSVASTLVTNFATANYATVNSVASISTLQANSARINSTIVCSSITSNLISSSALSATYINGAVGQFTSTLTSNASISGTLGVSTLYGSTATISGSINAAALSVNTSVSVGNTLTAGSIIATSSITSLSTMTIGSSLSVPSANITTLTGNTINLNSAIIQSTVIIGSTLIVPTIQISTLIGAVQLTSVFGSTLVANSAIIHSTLSVETSMSAPTASISVLGTSSFSTTNANVLSSLVVNSTLTVPNANITQLTGSLITTENATILSGLTIGSVFTTSYGLYSTLIGSTLNTTIANVMSTLTVGLSITAPTAYISSINGSTFTTNNAIITSTLTVPYLQLSTLFGSTITTTTANVLSTLIVGSTIQAPSIQISTLLGSTLTTTFAIVLSTLSVGSTLQTPYLQVSTLLGTSVTTTTANVLSLLTVGSTIVTPLLQVSTLVGSTLTATAIVGSTLTISSASISTAAISSLTVSAITPLSSFTASSMTSNFVTTTTLAVSTITDLSGVVYAVGGGGSATKSALVCSNLPVSLDTMSAVIDRTTQKIMLSYISSISTLYKTEYYAYNGSAYVQGYEVPPSVTPISLSTLKFPVGSNTLSAVGAWCAVSVTDMTTFTGTWDVTATCLRTGTNGDDLYALEMVRSINATALTTIPSPPTNVSAILYPVGNPYGISYTFTPPTVTGGYISGYEAFATSNGGVSYITQISLTSPIVVTGLTPGTNYTLTVKAKNAKGQSAAASTTPTTIVYKTLPDAPTSIVGTLYPPGNATGINVAFTYPINTGGGVDLYYTAAMDTASTQTTIVGSLATSPVYLSLGLIPGTTYRFAAYSQNAGGTGAASTSVGTLLYQIPPAAPSIQSLALTPAGNPTGVAVGFNPPANTGGGITDYITNLYSGALGTGTSASTIGTTSPITVTTGLVAGNTYSFRVAGRNTGGTGTLSATSSIVYKTLPGAPVLNMIQLYPVGNPTGIQVGFTAPGNTGGGIDTYTIYASSATTITYSSIGVSSPIFITGLTNFITYTMFVTATNAGGTGPGSNVSTIAYRTLPDPPTNVSGALYPVGAATGINVSFAYPLYSGGGVDLYYASAMDIASTASTITSALSVSPIFLTYTGGLVPGSTYKFAVYSKNAGGSSAASTSVSNLLFQIVPGVPTAITTLLTPVGNPTGVTVGFTPPSIVACGGITYYTAIAYSGATAVASTVGASSPLVVTTLTAGTNYGFVVTATNTAGTGVSSATSAITYKTLPSVPTNVSGALYPVGATTGINVSFTYPSDLGGGVDLYYAKALDTLSTQSTVMVSSPTSPIYITTAAGLVPGTTYKFAVFAYNAGGTTASTLSGASLLYQIPPTAPLSLTTTLTPAGNPYGISTLFNAPSNLGGGISYYTVSAYYGTNYIDTRTGTSFAYLFSTPTTNLIAGFTYTFYANATNTGGTSPSSIASAIVYKTLPDPPTNVVGALYPVGAGQGINITFSAPSNNGGGIDLYYATAMDTASTVSTVLSTSATSPIYLTTSLGLSPGSTYKFAVYAKNAGGSSLATISATSLFYQTLPTAPTSASVALDPALNPTGAMVTFTPPVGNFGGITNYTAVAYLGGTTPVASTIQSSSPIKITGLTAGTLYTYDVAAINTAGTGPVSNRPTLTYYTKPGVATGLSAALDPVATPTGVAVSFTPTATTGGGALTYTASAYSGVVLIASGSGGSSPVKVLASAGLIPGNSYTFSIVASNASVAGDTSAATGLFTYVTNPAAPTGAAATVGYSVGSQKATITWTGSATTGGSAITSYSVSSSPAGYTSGALASNATSVTTGAVLTNGTSYTFTILVTNANGLTNSVTTAAVTPYGVAGQPTGLAATAGVRQIGLTWNAGPTNGAAITNYRITQTGGANNTIYVGSAALSSTITSLSNNTSYTYTVAATNDNVNYGTDSTSASATTFTVPSQPQSLSGAQNGTAGQLVLSWTAPSSTGGSPITSYDVALNSAFTTSVANLGSTATTYTFTGLTKATLYTLYVRANSVVGNGTSASTTATTPDTPSAPTSVTAAQNGSVGQLVLQWAAPSSTGGTVITSYDVALNSAFTISAVNLGSGATTYTFTGLSSSTAYTLYVRANNGAGNGLVASGSASTPTTPAAPTSVTTAQNGTAGSLTLSWVAPSNGGNAITGYAVSTDNFATTTASLGAGATSYVFTGLGNNTTPTLYVRAINSVGSGLVGSANNATTPTTPTAPQSITDARNGTAGSLTLSWSAPSSTGGTAITGYAVSTDNFATTTGTTNSSTTNYVFTGLGNNTKPTLYVRAVNGAGSGLIGSTNTATTPSVPAAPTVSATALTTSTGISASWTVPDAGGLTITGYQLALVSDFSSIYSTYPATTTSDTVTGLSAGTNYTIYVRASNSIGYGSGGASSAVTTLALPGTPPSVTISTPSTAGSLTLNWGTATGTNITDYLVSSGGTYFSSGGASVRTYTFTGLTNNTSYTLYVVAQNGAGRSATAGFATATTVTTPSAPTSVSVSTASVAGKLTLNWSAPSSNGGLTITNYYVSSGGAYTATGSTSSPQSYTFTGLSSGTSYTLYVYAYNSIGGGTVASASGTTLNPPAAPTSLDATAGTPLFATLTWTAGSGNGLTITGYQISGNGGSNWSSTIGITTDGSSNTVAQSGTACTYIYTTVASTIYSFQVRAVTSAGPGAVSNTKGLSIPAAPSYTVVSSGVDIGSDSFDNTNSATVTFTVKPNTNVSYFVVHIVSGGPNYGDYVTDVVATYISSSSSGDYYSATIGWSDALGSVNYSISAYGPGGHT